MQTALQGLLQGLAGSLPLDRAAELSAIALSIVRMLASSDSQLFTAVISSGSPPHTTQQEAQSRWQYTTMTILSAMKQTVYTMLDGSQCAPSLDSVHKTCH